MPVTFYSAVLRCTSQNSTSSGRTYVDFLTRDAGHDRSGRPTAPLYDRLALIKGQCDPDNLFGANQNIRPAGG
jgi:Berberine and berberine like